MATFFIHVAVFMQLLLATARASLNAYNVDVNSISVSGFSSGGFMAAQLGIAYSEIFKTGFGVFAGGPYDCARDQHFHTCLYNDTPSIEQPLANMYAWSGGEIDCLCNLKHRRIFLQSGTEDDIVGLGIVRLLESQLSRFTEPSNFTFAATEGAAHVFPTDFHGHGNNPCNQSVLPYVANCGYDGAGEVLRWLYGDELNQRNTGTPSGSIIPFAQTGKFGSPGLAKTGYLYVPEPCQTREKATCRLHVALHGCMMNYETIGDKFVVNTGHNMWADTNNIIVLYPQTTVDNGTYPTWSGNLRNSNACFDWIGQYGESDWKGGLQMEAIVNMVKAIASGSRKGHGYRSQCPPHLGL